MKKLRGMVINFDTYIIVDFPSLSEAQEFVKILYNEAEKLDSKRNSTRKGDRRVP